jgi:hypothetical protein
MSISRNERVLGSEGAVRGRHMSTLEFAGVGEDLECVVEVLRADPRPGDQVEVGEAVGVRVDRLTGPAGSTS